MASQDDLTLLKRMYERGEVSEEQYDTLRRQVLRGAPLQQLIDEPAPVAGPPPRPPVRADGPPPRAWSPSPDRSSAASPPPAGRPWADMPPAGGPRTDRPASRRADRPPAAGPRTDRGDLPPAHRAAARREEPPGRRRRAPKLFAALTSVVLALALVAAGVWWFVLRDPGVDAPAYARTVCTSVRDWQQGLDARSAALVRSIAEQDDRTAVRSAVRSHYADIAAWTDGLRTAVLDAGVADVPGGRDYADSLAVAVGEEAAALRDLAGRAERLDADSPALFRAGLQELLTGGETAVSAVTAALARPEGGTPALLRQALSSEPACAPYVG